jgi:outer membrane protein assembly factor BamB
MQPLLGLLPLSCNRLDLSFSSGLATNRPLMRTSSPILIALILITNGWAADWPQFRGPQASGLSSNGPAPIRWDVSKDENVRWRMPIPGLAHASPILWGDRVYVATAVPPGKADLKVGLYGDIRSANDVGPQQWRLLALDEATGKVAWNTLGHEAVPRVKRHTKASHCNSTPATDGKRIVAIFGSEGLFCFDVDGKSVWKKDLGPMDSGYFQVPTAQWGFASSPVIYENKVVVLCDVQTNSFIAVFDLLNGNELWRTPRKDVPTWSTPTVAKTGNQTQILVNGWHHTGGYDFVTGKELWQLDGGGDIPTPTPIVANGLGYFTSAHGRFRPMRAIRLEARGNLTANDPGATNAAVVWAHARQGNYMQTPIIVGDNLYGCQDNGVLTCFDAKTGAIQYSERIGNGSEGFTSSPVSDGRHLFFASEIGNVYVIAANRSLSVVATNSLNETCMASPALSEGTLFYRTREHLVAIGARK